MLFAVSSEGCSYVVGLPLLELLGLAVVPVLYRPVVSGDPAVDLGLLSALGTYAYLAGYVSVVPAYGIGRGDGVVRQLSH